MTWACIRGGFWQVFKLSSLCWKNKACWCNKPLKGTHLINRTLWSVYTNLEGLKLFLLNPNNKLLPNCKALSQAFVKLVSQSISLASFFPFCLLTTSSLQPLMLHLVQKLEQKLSQNTDSFLCDRNIGPVLSNLLP